MQTITLEIADNGIIKTIVDDNINGAGQSFESKVVYDLERHDTVDTKVELLYQLAEDIGVDLGNSKQADQIKIVSEWGEHYTPQENEIKEVIEELKSKLKHFEGLLQKK